MELVVQLGLLRKVRKNFHGGNMCRFNTIILEEGWNQCKQVHPNEDIDNDNIENGLDDHRAGGLLTISAKKG